MPLPPRDSLSDRLPYPAILVYETVLDGPAGSVMARFARDVYQADPEARLGPSGFAYALPVAHTAQRALPATAIIRELHALFDHARDHPKITFLLPAVGRRRARLRIHESAFLATLRDAPANVEIAGAWRNKLTPEERRVAVVGRGRSAALALEKNLDPLLAAGAKAEIVRGLAADDDPEVERYAAARGVDVVRFSPLLGLHHELAQSATAIMMAWYASHVWFANAKPALGARELKRHAAALQLPITQLTTSSR